MIQDEQVMLKVQKGNVELLGLLFERYHQELYNFFLKTLADRDLSGDLTQTVFLRILKYNGSFKSSQKFRSWMYQIARNVRIDHFKSSGFLAEALDVDDVSNLVVDHASETRQLEKDSVEMIQRAMNHLSIEKRELITHGILMDMTISELADVYGITRNNARVKLHRVVQELRTIYKKMA